MKNKVILYTLLSLLLILFFALGKIVFYPPESTVFSLTNIRSMLELFSFTSSTLLLIAALLGLKQLQYAQKEIETAKIIFRTQSKRAAYEAAVNECRNFSVKVIPLINRIEKFAEENKVSYFQDAIIEEVEGGFVVNLSKVNKKQAAKLSEIEETIQEYMNNMELFALYFVSKIADENIAFLTLGKLYVSESERLAKILPLTNGTPDDCKAIWVLYASWKDRLKKQELEKVKNDADKELKKITIKTRKAIGTE